MVLLIKGQAILAPRACHRQQQIAAVLVVDIKHLFVHLLHGNAAPEHRGHGQGVTIVAVTSGHSALAIEHLLGEPGYYQGPVLLAALAGEK